MARQIARMFILSGTVLVAACGVLPELPAPGKAPAPIPAPTPPRAESPSKPPAAPAPKPEAAESAAAPALTAVTWDQVAGWDGDDPRAAWDAFVTSCNALRQKSAWTEVCRRAEELKLNDSARSFFETNFTPYQVSDADGNDRGLVTGYYEPLLNGSRKASARYRYPLYAVPDDLLVVDLADVYPELKGMRLRGRLQGRRVVPYYNRAQIDSNEAPLKGRELLWVDDPIELFFLQIQGSGRVRLDTGELIPVGYGEQNGYPYRSIGRLLVDRGDLPLEKASMQGIKIWARQNPDKLAELLNYNASYVFFRELPAGLPGPLGALGVPLTAGRSLAVDARFIPLGAPVFLSTTWPNSSRPLNRLMLAQDTGGAIRGAVRADFFWGFGDDAAREAGRMKQPARMWVLLPAGYPLQLQQ
jgi:membrane-bound lytic murein transglycosylase A